MPAVYLNNFWMPKKKKLGRRRQRQIFLQMKFRKRERRKIEKLRS